MIALTEQVVGHKVTYDIISLDAFREEARENHIRAEQLEILVRYQYDNIFVTDKFTKRFPTFKVTSFADGVRTILA